MIASSLVVAGLCCGVGCRRPERSSIAVVPRTSGTILWEPENVGAQTAAEELGEQIYWNASTREDDVDGQIALVDRIRSAQYRGMSGVETLHALKAAGKSVRVIILTNYETDEASTAPCRRKHRDTY